jgi:DNA-binding GntR family transcriptional regulator
MSVQKDSVRDQVRRTLTERILAGHYKPGDRLVELQIARELGTSQGSVREALRELEASRLVESEPRHGTRVRVVSLKEMRDAYLARGLLEQAAAATATRAFKGNVGKLTEEYRGILRAADLKDLGDQAAHVYAFHRTIVEASGNCVLLRLWESLAFETRVRILLGWSAIDLEQVKTSYQAILTALERGDPRAAGRLLREHAECFAPVAEAGPPSKTSHG